MSVSNDESSRVRPTLYDMNPNELEYYTFMISLKTVLEVVMFCPQKCVFQMKQKICMLKHLI